MASVTVSQRCQVMECVACLAVHVLVTQVGEDPFTKLKQEKRERVKDQQKRQLQNVKASAKAVGSSAALPPTLKLAAALPAHGKGKPTKRKDMHDDVRSPCSCKVTSHLLFHAASFWLWS